MDINNLKHVVGKAEASQPAIIRFFGPVDCCSVQEFNDEFLWLQDYVKPSKIVVMINSEGGSVIQGMSTFSIIHSCPIETDCVIEGIAASMGSVIWAAGDNLFMHDYSLLMIHNPFNYGDPDDPDTQQTINAFRSQLETIYRKRFGMSKEQVQKIMDGEENVDGTFFTAQEAVKAGFIDNSHVIKTSKTVRDKVSNQIDGVADAPSLRSIMLSVAAEIDENKLLEEVAAIHNQTDNSNFQDPKTMKENNETLNFDTVSAQLGISKDAQMTEVTARIAALIKSEADLKELQAKNADLEIKFNGKEAELANVKNELEEVKASLKKYQDAEEAAREAEITAVIDDAVKAGKIDESAKETWNKMAHTNFDLVKDTLASIQGRDNIVQQIANDPNNVKDAEGAMKTAEEKMAEQVKSVVGDFQLKKF